MKYLILVSLSIVALSGCVSTKNIPAEKVSLESMRDQKLSNTLRDKPSFSAMTAGKAAFGMLGAAAMINAGNKIIQENDVDDPANYIAESLLADLKVSFDADSYFNNSIKIKNEKPAQVAAVYKEFSYVLDVRTINWSFGYFPADWNNYRVMYSAKLRLIETSKGRVLSEGFCSRVPDKTEDSPSKEELLGNNAERLKNELKIAADHCIEEFKNNLFGL